MAPDDVLFYADTGDETMKVEAFGVKLQISDLLDVDPKGAARGSQNQGSSPPRLRSHQRRALPLPGRHPPPAGLRGAWTTSTAPPVTPPACWRTNWPTRWAKRSYQGIAGTCAEECDDPIPEERRRHVPGVRLCVPCKTRLERLGR